MVIGKITTLFLSFLQHFPNDQNCFFRVLGMHRHSDRKAVQPKRYGLYFNPLEVKFFKSQYITSGKNVEQRVTLSTSTLAR